MIRIQKKIGEILIERGLITQAQLEDALAEQARTNKFLGDILIKNRKILEKDLLSVLAKQFNLSFIELHSENINWDFVKKFSPSLILDHKCIPIRQDEWSVTFGINNPLDVNLIKRAEDEARGLKLNLVLISRNDLEGFIVKYKQQVQRNV